MEGADEGGKKKVKKIKPGSFQGLGLSQEVYKAIMKMGYNMPTPIQRKTIPTILDGQDVVAMARTGSGKTAAFLIPICERLKMHSVAVGTRAVVLSPTRELAMQTCKFFRQLGRYCGLRCCLLVGGQAMEAQFEHLANNPDVIIATPGRLMHHILEAEISLSRVEMLVFDEADRLFELGFAEQLQSILDGTPISRQVLLFSATLPAHLVSFTRAGIKDPVFVRLDVETSLSEQLDLWYLYVRKDEKLAAAVSVLRRLHQDGKRTIMFVATRHHVEFFGELLTQLGMKSAIVYGAMDQEARTEQIANFRKKRALIMVTTDVAARGIDIPLLDHVLNYDFPPSSKLFVHRSGRTARAGQSGLAVSLVTLDDLPYTVELMLFLGQKLKVADGSTNNQGRSVIGALPGLETDVETLTRLLEDKDTAIHSLHKSMMVSYHLYNKTRPAASKQSVSRAKEMLESCGGASQLQCLLHPAFAEAESQFRAAGPDAERKLLQELRSFRPKKEKVGNVISVGGMSHMDQAKLDASAVAATKAQQRELAPEDGEEGSESEEGEEGGPARGPKKRKAAAEPRIKRVEKARLSKRARKELAKGGGGGGEKAAPDFSGFDIQIDGVDLGNKSAGKVKAEKKEKPEQFYLSIEKDQQVEAREQGLEMEQYQMDLMPDDSSDIKKAKSVIRWDAKKKKYLPVMVSVDGRVVKGQRKNESGVKVKGDGEKSEIYKKWAASTKRRIQKVGELEQGYQHPLGKFNQLASGPTVMEFNNDGEITSKGVNRDGEEAAKEGGRVQKPVVPFHGEVQAKYLTNKQKRMMKRREGNRVMQGTDKQELKSVTQMNKDKKKRGENMLKQKPHLRKAKAQAKKEQRQNLQMERQMKNGARTKAKMLVIEGEGRAKNKGPRVKRAG